MEKLQWSIGGRNSGKTFELQMDWGAKWHLSTEGYYFKYRPDKNNISLIRATLYKVGIDRVVDDVGVSANHGLPHKSHHAVINHFEARLTLGKIK